MLNFTSRQVYSGRVLTPIKDPSNKRQKNDHVMGQLDVSSTGGGNGVENCQNEMDICNGEASASTGPTSAKNGNLFDYFKKKEVLIEGLKEVLSSSSSPLEEGPTTSSPAKSGTVFDHFKASVPSCSFDTNLKEEPPSSSRPTRPTIRSAKSDEERWPIICEYVMEACAAFEYKEAALLEVREKEAKLKRKQSHASKGILSKRSAVVRNAQGGGVSSTPLVSETLSEETSKEKKSREGCTYSKKRSETRQSIEVLQDENEMNEYKKVNCCEFTSKHGTKFFVSIHKKRFFVTVKGGGFPAAILRDYIVNGISNSQLSFPEDYGTSTSKRTKTSKGAKKTSDQQAQNEAYSKYQQVVSFLEILFPTPPNYNGVRKSGNGDYNATIMVNHIEYHISSHKNQVQAAHAFDFVASELRNHQLNFPENYPNHKYDESADTNEEEIDNMLRACEACKTQTFSGYRGVRLYCGKWQTRIFLNDHMHTIGEYETAEEAARWYDYWAKRVPHTRLNFAGDHKDEQQKLASSLLGLNEEALADEIMTLTNEVIALIHEASGKPK